MYFTPNTLGGFFGELAMAIGGNPDNYTNAAGENLKNDGDYYGFNVGYQNGPIYAGVSSAITPLRPNHQHAAGSDRFIGRNRWRDHLWSGCGRHARHQLGPVVQLWFHQA